jgi:hypothetical protein
MTDHTPQTEKKLADAVLQRLQDEQVKPVPRWCWQCLESVLWMLWCASVLFGALSISIFIFAAVHMRFDLYEATHDSVLEYAVELLPYIWIFIFIVMLVLAYRNLRHTKTGYRYTFAQVVVSSVFFSILGGILLHVAGVGARLDKQLGDYMPTYYSLEERELQRWQRPELGRLVGTHLPDSGSTTTALFIDSEGVRWQLNIIDLQSEDVVTLQTGRRVRVLGLPPNSATTTIHACGVFPWMFDKPVSSSEMMQERQAFIDRMYAHKDRAPERDGMLVQEVFGQSAVGKCADMPVIQRIEASMQ